MNTFAILLALLVGISRIAGRSAGGDAFTAGVIFFFAYLAILMAGLVVERSVVYYDPLVTVRHVIAVALLVESLVDLILSVVRYRQTRRGKYIGYALLFLLFFSFLVGALVGSLPVGALD